MARPIKNSCDYFSHDRDMRNHKKIKAIRTRFKASGYAIWCMLLEYLTGNDGNVIENSALEYELMAGDFDVSVTELSDVIYYCIKLELLEEEDGFIRSKSLDKRLEPVYRKRGIAKSLSDKQLRNNGKFATEKTDTTVVSVTEKPQSKVKESKGKHLLIFDEFRKNYPGTKGGNEKEFDNFCKKHKDWSDVLPTLGASLTYQVETRAKLKAIPGKFVPEWKNMQTWINQRCWEEEIEGYPKTAVQKADVKEIPTNEFFNTGAHANK